MRSIRRGLSAPEQNKMPPELLWSFILHPLAQVKQPWRHRDPPQKEHPNPAAAQIVGADHFGPGALKGSGP